MRTIASLLVRPCALLCAFCISCGSGAALDEAGADPGGDRAEHVEATAQRQGLVAIANTAKIAWDVMKDNRSVSNVQADNANALPEGVAMGDLTGWSSAPATAEFSATTSSFLFGGTDLDVLTKWYWGGSDGVGKYIVDATVTVSGHVQFGHTVDIFASIGAPMNVGTSDRPIAALPITIRLHHTTALLNEWASWSLLVRGDGRGSGSRD